MAPSGRLPANDTPPCSSPAASESPSNTASFEVEEGSDLFLGSIRTRCSVTAAVSLSLRALLSHRSTRALPADPAPSSSCPACPPPLAALLQEEGLCSPPPAAGGWPCVPHVAQEGCPAAPAPPGSQCQSRGARGAQGHS